MKNLCTSVVCITLILAAAACSPKEDIKTITIKNTLDMERAAETVELTKQFLKVEDLAHIGIRDMESEELQVVQTVDSDGDGSLDVLLFQPIVAANAESKYEVITVEQGENPTKPELCYSRFVPERTDDYAWENDKVAFRVYGPTAQRMVEEKIPGGTLSSGVDAWLKKVAYPIINNWYHKETQTDGTYHEDTGEGLDDFHVGASRGVGGIGVKVDSVYYFSKNFSQWRTITTGPIRTSFALEYEDWDASGNRIKESKIVHLDLGQNLTKFITSIEGTDKISAGLTLHEKDGEVTGNMEKGWVSYWQPHGDSELGTAIIAEKKYFEAFEKYDTGIKDLSNAYAHLKVLDNAVAYYAGFTWKPTGQFTSKQEWEAYLNLFSQQINNPLLVSVIN